VLAACVGTLFSRWKLWPNHTGETPDQRWAPFSIPSALLGVGAGVAVAILLLAGSAVLDNLGSPSAHAVPLVHGISGRYVAIGDSYSAGEGLRPFFPGTAATNCDRSESQAYSELLKFSGDRVPLTIRACSGAVISDILHSVDRNGITVPAQVNGTVQPDVGLVTLTIGGNDMFFSKILIACMADANCLHAQFPPTGVTDKYVPRAPLASWSTSAILDVGKRDARLFHALRREFPMARIVVLGCPYLFPDGAAPYWPLNCFSILRRVSEPVRDDIRTLEDRFNNEIYEEAIAAHLEFVSPNAMWQGHEPCGSAGQYTNSIKPYLSFTSPVDSGSFHPNTAGQQTLAAWSPAT